MHLLFRFLSLWPLRALHVLGAFLGWCTYGLSPGYRQVFRTNATLAGVSPADCRRAIAHAGRMVAELPRLWLGKPVPVVWEGREYIQSALAAKTGIVFLTPHLGSFEVTARAYADCFGSQAPMTVLYRPQRKLWADRWVRRSRARPGLHTAPVNLAGVKQLVRALRHGQCVGLLPDQVPPEGQGAWAPFFGREAYTMTLAARLAAQTGATVLLAWGERLASGRGFCIHVAPFSVDLSGDTSPDLRGATPGQAGLTSQLAAFNQALEVMIRRCPSQYLWGYARFKQPRKLS